MTITFKDVRDFSISRIFECGQAFRWNPENDGSYTGVAGGRAANIAFTPSQGDAYAGEVTIRELAVRSSAGTGTAGRAFWEDYLDLRRDYGEINRRLSGNDKTMTDAIACGKGIRILSQDAWETLISFIISQNNHIKRIQGCIERLCKNFGERIGEADGTAFFDFPGIGKLASLSEAELAPCGLGYRDRYLCTAARQVLEAGGSAWLESLRGKPPAEAKAILLTLCGVGEKVASCALLFGLGHMGSFPVDVWIKRAMQELYDVDARDAASCAAERFGPYAGIAQQYLFFYMRERMGNG